jgi:hypothetical protein
MLVKLRRTDAVVGTLEFFGIPVAKADGYTWIEFNVRPCAGEVKIVPAGVATGPEIGAIADSLCRNETRGRVGRFEWELAAESPPSPIPQG